MIARLAFAGTQLLDWVSSLALPPGAERNFAAAHASPLEGLALKAALVVGVLAAVAVIEWVSLVIAAEAPRRSLVTRLIAEGVLLAGVIGGAYGWGTNMGAVG